MASEPRQSHGNGAQADPKVVDTTLKSEQAQRADAALGGQDSNLPARAGTPGAVIEQPAATPEAEKPKPRLPGPTGHQAPGR